ncbi:hypothetical protein O181_011946 [Austropuccinia psidii MF-1]|uniref:Uncharacterized protein n=1 Tax=Austropuccinia psidii MF-1 TaxID=1389203 RepID=A0A9Q3BTP7_9BASI|nr:hypothetical protein [Austropuccinia psidii MF-1]
MTSPINQNHPDSPKSFNKSVLRGNQNVPQIFHSKAKHRNRLSENHSNATPIRSLRSNSQSHSDGKVINLKQKKLPKNFTSVSTNYGHKRKNSNNPSSTPVENHQNQTKNLKKSKNSSNQNPKEISNSQSTLTKTNDSFQIGSSKHLQSIKSPLNQSDLFQDSFKTNNIPSLLFTKKTPAPNQLISLNSKTKCTKSSSPQTNSSTHSESFLHSKSKITSPNTSHTMNQSPLGQKSPNDQDCFPLGLRIETQCSPLTYQVMHSKEKIHQLNRAHGGWIEKLPPQLIDFQSDNFDRNHQANICTTALSTNNQNSTPSIKRMPCDWNDPFLEPIAGPMNSSNLKKLQDFPNRHTTQAVTPSLMPTESPLKSRIIVSETPPPSSLKSNKTLTLDELPETQDESGPQRQRSSLILCPNSFENHSLPPHSLDHLKHSSQPNVTELGCAQLEQESMLPLTQKSRANHILLFDSYLEESADLKSGGLSPIFPPSQTCQSPTSSFKTIDPTNYPEFTKQKSGSFPGIVFQPDLSSFNGPSSRIIVEDSQLASPPKKILAEDSQESPQRNQALTRSLAPPTPISVRVKPLKAFLNSSLHSKTKSPKSILALDSSLDSVNCEPQQVPNSSNTRHGNEDFSEPHVPVPQKSNKSDFMSQRVHQAWTSHPQSRLSSAKTFKQLRLDQFATGSRISSSSTATGREQRRLKEQEAQLASAEQDRIRKLLLTNAEREVFGRQIRLPNSPVSNLQEMEDEIVDADPTLPCFSSDFMIPDSDDVDQDGSSEGKGLQSENLEKQFQDRINRRQQRIAYENATLLETNQMILAPEVDKKTNSVDQIILGLPSTKELEILSDNPELENISTQDLISISKQILASSSAAMRET